LQVCAAILQDIPASGLVLLVNEPIGVVNGMDEFPYSWLNFGCILRGRLGSRMWYSTTSRARYFAICAIIVALLCAPAFG
jgi:hypothetical protein